jgi:hypothetical protein
VSVPAAPACQPPRSRAAAWVVVAELDDIVSERNVPLPRVESRSAQSELRDLSVESQSRRRRWPRQAEDRARATIQRACIDVV